MLREHLVAAVRFTVAPAAQIGVAVVVIAGALLLFALALLRFVPGLEQYALAKDEPFWILVLSILALLYAGLSALPAALAYREAAKLTPDE